MNKNVGEKKDFYNHVFLFALPFSIHKFWHHDLLR
jgi:hypothetical protein